MSNQFSTAFSAALNAGQCASTIMTQSTVANQMPGTTQSFLGARSTPQVQDVIQGVLPIGLSLLILDNRRKDASGRIPRGGELGFLMAQSVQSGVPFLGKYPVVQGDALVAVNEQYWSAVYSALPVRESLTTLPYRVSPLGLGGRTPAEFLRSLTDIRPMLKMIVIDNLEAMLKHSWVAGGVTQFTGAVTAVHSACERSNLALLAIIDKTVASQKKLWKDITDLDLDSTLNVVEVTDKTAKAASAGIWVKVNGVKHDLQFVNGRWVEASTANGGQVKALTKQGRVLLALKGQQASATVSDLVPSTNLYPSQILSALQALKNAGLVEQPERGLYRAV